MRNTKNPINTNDGVKMTGQVFDFRLNDEFIGIVGAIVGVRVIDIDLIAELNLQEDIGHP